MIRTKVQNELPPTEPQTGRPAGTAEQWLGHNRSAKRRLWERLNPRNRKHVRLIAEALSLQQTHGRLPDTLRVKLAGVAEEVERVARRVSTLLAEIARKTPPNP